MEISIYGTEGCPRRAEAAEFISAGGVQVTSKDIESEPLGTEVLERLLSFEQDSPSLGGATAAELRSLLKERPASLGVPVAVRGSRVVIASDLARIQNLMY